jgi:hypothetical protein
MVPIVEAMLQQMESSKLTSGARMELVEKGKASESPGGPLTWVLQGPQTQLSLLLPDILFTPSPSLPPGALP